MVFSYQFTEDDYLEFWYHSSWQGSWNKKKRKKYYFRVIFFTALAIGFFLYSLRNSFRSDIPLTFFILGALYVCFLFLMVKNNFRDAVKKIYAHPDNANFFCRTELSFDETGITAKNEFAETRYTWPAIVRKSSTSGHYFLYLSQMSALIIPKRIFKSEADKEAFEKMLSQHLPLQTNLASIDNKSYFASLIFISYLNTSSALWIISLFL